MKTRRPDFSRRVRALMHSRQVSRWDVALALGVCEDTVKRWLGGKLPTVEDLNKLADFLAVTPTDLVLDLAKYGFDASGNLSLKAVEPRRDLLKFSDVRHLLSIGHSTLDALIRHKVFLPVDIRVPGNTKPAWRISRMEYDAYLKRKLKERATRAAASTNDSDSARNGTHAAATNGNAKGLRADAKPSCAS